MTAKIEIIDHEGETFVPMCIYAPVLYEYKHDCFPRQPVIVWIGEDEYMLSDYCTECSHCRSYSPDDMVLECDRYLGILCEKNVTTDHIGFMLEAKEELQIRSISYDDGSWVVTWGCYEGTGRSERSAILSLEKTIVSSYKTARNQSERDEIRAAFHIW